MALPTPMASLCKTWPSCARKNQTTTTLLVMPLSLERPKLVAATRCAGLLGPVALQLCPHMAANIYRFLTSTVVGATVLVQPLGCSRPPRTSFLFRVTLAVAAKVSAWVFVFVGPTSLSKLKSSPCLLAGIAALRCCKYLVAGGARLAQSFCWRRCPAQ